MPFYHVGVTYEVTVWSMVEADSPKEAKKIGKHSLVLPDDSHTGVYIRTVVEDEDRKKVAVERAVRRWQHR